MGERIKECWNCRYYKPYYTKGYFQFAKQKTGCCKIEGKTIIDKHEKCAMWCNDSRIRHMRQIIAVKKIDETLNCLLQIKQILFEEKEELKKPELAVLDLDSVNRLHEKYLSDK